MKRKASAKRIAAVLLSVFMLFMFAKPASAAYVEELYKNAKATGYLTRGTTSAYGETTYARGTPYICIVDVSLTCHYYQGDGTHTVGTFSKSGVGTYSASATVSPANCYQTYYSSSTHTVKYSNTDKWTKQLSE